MMDEWVVEEINIKEKTIGNSLTHPEQSRGVAAWKFVWAIKKEWWWGRRVLRHAVHSCGKKNPNTRFFSTEVVCPDGSRVEKPHPKYYIAYEDVKIRFTFMI
ncbi:hypothetical protein XELAEV_18028788mg [Xenopus laevis]|uniref:Uncharacterized protein n=1 Tax=Xenopus laevis TaxID=8355 RepID=A0A974CQC6_XENLA|nr:hypothetical protein XELAEV_18028788mg [Xenopus laevis]